MSLTLLPTKNEQALYETLKKTQEEKKKVEDDMKNLQERFSLLETKYEEIVKQLNPKKNEEKSEYHTDEEDLAKETEWIRQKAKRNNNKKRKMDTSLSPPQQQQVQEENAPKKVPLPPPIVVEGIKNYDQLYEELNEKIDGNFQIKLMNGDNMKINVKNEDAYKSASKLISEKNYSWYSFENKQNRPIRVVAKNLHYSCKSEKIVKELLNRGYKAVAARNQLKWRTKEPLNMFMIEFKPDENINKIFEISDIQGTRVQIVPLKTSRLVPQCKRCQAYGHTQHYCSKEARCVKCAGKHITIDCKMATEARPKCIHCGDAHPASYRGCIVAKEMQKLKQKQLKKPEAPAIRRAPSTANPKTNNRTYAQTVSGSNTEPQFSNKQEDNSIGQTLLLILSRLDKFDERLTKLEYSAQGAIPKYKNGQRS